MSHDQGEKPFLGARIKKDIPGTAEYKAVHGGEADGTRATGLKSHIPGTDEHRIRHESDIVGDDHRSHFPPHAGDQRHGGAHTHGTEEQHMHKQGLQDTFQTRTAPIGTVGDNAGDPLMGYGTGLGASRLGDGALGAPSGPSGAGAGGYATHQGYPVTGMGTAGVDASSTAYGSTGAGQGGGEVRESMGHKIKKNIPGTREHEEKKIEQGRI